MKDTYVQKTVIPSSLVNYKEEMRFDTLLHMFQNIAIFHSKDLGVSFEEMLENSNAFWVLTKIKVYVEKMPKWNELATFSTYPTDILTYRFMREYLVEGEEGAKVYAHSEWCAIDAENGSIRRSNTIKYPFDLNRRTDNLPLSPFNRYYCDTSLTNKVFSYTIRLTDIDVNKHTNNVTYARLALNAFTIDEWESYDFKSFEIKFVNQSYYGDTVDVFKKVLEDNSVYICGFIGEKTIFSVLLSNTK